MKHDTICAIQPASPSADVHAVPFSIGSDVCAPGIGPEVAEAVLRTYATPISLFTAYRTAMQQVLEHHLAAQVSPIRGDAP